MSYMAEIDGAQQEGLKFIRMRIHTGEHMNICTSCLALSRKQKNIRHSAKCKNKVLQTNKFKFAVGRSYRLQSGKVVKIVRREQSLVGYETVLCSDGKHRYDRSTHSDDAGRCTGTPHDYSCPDNFERK